METLIYNANIISPQVDISCGAVLVKGNIIRQVYEHYQDLPQADNMIDAQGQKLIPGFIDIHTHGLGGYDVCDGTLEAIENISRLKLQEGCTSYCPTTLTLSQEQLEASLKAVALYQEKEQFAKVLGVHLEGPFVSQKYIGAQNPQYARLPSAQEIENLNSISPIAIVTYAPELEGGLEITQALSDRGIIPSAGHSGASCNCIRQAQNLGLKHLTHLGNQMSGLHHREIGMVGEGLMNEDLLVEVICDRIHLSDDMLKLIFKLKNKDKIAAITDSLSVTGLPNGEYELGGLPITLENGICRLKEGGALAGSTLRMNEALRNIYTLAGLPLQDIIQVSSYNQAQSLGLEALGKIEPGFIADMVLLDDDFNVINIFLGGQLQQVL